jgi:hypothetical protein
MPEKFDNLDVPPAEARIPVAVATVAPASAPAATAVQSAAVDIVPELPAIAELEAFLVAIERARRDTAPLAVR